MRYPRIQGDVLDFEAFRFEQLLILNLVLDHIAA